MGDDIISAFMRRLLEDVPDTAPDVVRRIEHGLRRDFGGDQHYVKKVPAEGKAFRLGALIAAGVPLGVAISEIGCSQASAYRYMARRWRR